MKEKNKKVVKDHKENENNSKLGQIHQSQNKQQ